MTGTLTYSPVIVVDTTGMENGTWLDYRRQGIGGSDVAAVYGQSPFCTTRELYYQKIGVKPVVEEESNWVAKEYGHLLEDLVARIFSFKTGLRVYKKNFLFAHPNYSFMQANVDYFVELPDGSEAILECKTCNYNCRDKWDDDAIPFNYELQVRHYMAVTNINKAFIACLYGNNDSEFVYRNLERDLDFEADMIEQEKYFWESYVEPKIEPPFTEDGDLVLAAIRRYKGKPDPSASAVKLDKSLAPEIAKYLELREKKLEYDHLSAQLEDDMKTVYAPIIDQLGTSCMGICKNGTTEYTVSYKPSYRIGITSDNLKRLELNSKNIYDDFVTKTESRRLSIKCRDI